MENIEVNVFQSERKEIDGDIRRIIEKLLENQLYGWILVELHELVSRLHVSFSENDKKTLNRLSSNWMIRSRGDRLSGRTLKQFMDGIGLHLQDLLRSSFLLKEEEYVPIFFVNDDTELIPALSARSFHRYLMLKNARGQLNKPPLSIPSDVQLSQIFEDLTDFEKVQLLISTPSVLPDDTFSQKVVIPYFFSKEAKNILDQLFQQSMLLKEAMFKVWELSRAQVEIKEVNDELLRTLRSFDPLVGSKTTVDKLYPKIIAVKIEEINLRCLDGFDAVLSFFIDEIEKIRKIVRTTEGKLGTNYFGDDGYPRLSGKVGESLARLKARPQYSLTTLDTIWKAWFQSYLLQQFLLGMKSIMTSLQKSGTSHPSPFVLLSFLEDEGVLERIEHLFDVVNEELGRSRQLIEMLRNDHLNEVDSMR